MNNPVGWFEIPVVDMERAVKFYNEVFDYDFSLMDLGGLKMAIFPAEHKNSGSMGALVQNKENYKPSDSAGVLIYFSCLDVADTIKKILPAGGTIISDKKLIAPDTGYMGLIIDSEGNRIALHSNQ